METTYLDKNVSSTNYIPRTNSVNELTPVERAVTFSDNLGTPGPGEGFFNIVKPKAIKRSLTEIKGNFKNSQGQIFGKCHFATAEVTSQVELVMELMPKAGHNSPTSKESISNSSTLTLEQKTRNIISEMSEEETVSTLEEYMTYLHNVDTYRFDETKKELRFFKILVSIPASKKKRKGISVMTDRDIVSLFKAIVDQNYKTPFYEDKYKANFNNMYFILVTMWNGTDSSATLCERAVEGDIYVNLFHYLNSDVFSMKNGVLGKKQKLFVKGFLGILNNILQNVDVVSEFRKCNGIVILENFTKSTDDMVKCKALMTLSFIIDEKESEKLISDNKIIKFYLKILDSALESKTHWSKKYGYNAFEIVDALNRLAVNDSNKINIVNNGALKSYIELLTTGSNKEKSLAARGIWTLSFKAKDYILKEEECMQALKSLAKDDDVNVRKHARGALWVLQGNTENLQPADIKGDDSALPHIMISYQWDNQKTMIKVRNKLKECGFKVWMDIDKMSGSILEAMAQAIECASVVLVCMSEKYKMSPNCRTEGDYAFAKHKPIIPLRLQSKYTPDGWLGALVGSLLYMDFSPDKMFDDAFDRLIKELKDRNMSGHGLIEKQQSHDLSTMPTQANKTNSTRNCLQWNTVQVKKWLDENELGEISDRFSSFDGPLLKEYRFMFRDAPDFFYKTLEKPGLSLTQILKFSKAIRILKFED